MKQGNTQLIDRIAYRAAMLRDEYDLMEHHVALYWVLIHRQEIHTVHTRAVPLRLEDMLSANDIDFVHDVFGIHKHLVRGPSTARFTDCFVPRFAQTKPADLFREVD